MTDEVIEAEWIFFIYNTNTLKYIIFIVWELLLEIVIDDIKKLSSSETYLYIGMEIYGKHYHFSVNCVLSWKHLIQVDVL